MKNSAKTAARFPGEAEILLAAGLLILPSGLTAAQMGLLRESRLAVALSVLAGILIFGAAPFVLRKALQTGSLRLSRILDRIAQLGLLCLLLIIPLAYSTRFSTTLIFKETLAQTTAIFLTAVWLGRCLIRGRLFYVRTPYNVVVASLILLAFVSLLWIQPKCTSTRDLSLLLSFWILFHLFCLEMRHRRFRRKAFACVVIAGCIVAVISLAQLFKWDILRNTPFSGVWAQKDPRLKVSSTIGHNISIATFFLALGFLQLGWVLTARRKHQLVAALGLFVLSTAVIFISETRGVYVAFPLAILLLAILLLAFRGRPQASGWKVIRSEARRRLLLLMLVSGWGFSILGASMAHGDRIDPIGRLKTLQPTVLTPGTRVRLWTISLEMIRDHPLRGLGFQSFKFDYPFYQARYFEEHPDTKLVPTEKHTDRVHNEYLQVWVELGVLGLILTLLLLVLHVRFMWRQTHAVADGIKAARDDLFRTVLFAGIGGALVDAFFHFYLHVTSDALMMIFLLSTVVALSRPLRVRSIQMKGFTIRPLLTRGMVAGLGVIAVAVAVFGPAVIAPLLPGERFVEESRGPVAHITADALATPEERSLSRQLQRLGALQMLLTNPNKESLDEVRRHVGRLRQSVDRFAKSRELSGYRGQFSFYAGQCLARLGEIHSQLAPLETRVGLHDRAEQSRNRIAESFSDARFHLRHATEEYQFRHIYYELAKVDYYLGVKAVNQDREKATKLIDEAEICFRTAARIYPRDLAYHHDLAKFYLSARKDFNAAMDAWKQAYRLDPGFVDSRLIPEAEAQEKGNHLELAEWLYRAAFELAKEFLGLRGEITYGRELCKFYSRHGMPHQLERVALEINTRHKANSEAFWLAAYHLGSWHRLDDLERLVLNELEDHPLDVPLFERCVQVDMAYRHFGESGSLMPFWQRVANHPVEPQVAPHLFFQLGYRQLSIEGNPAASFAAFGNAVRMAAELPPDEQRRVGAAFQDNCFGFLLPLMLR